MSSEDLSEFERSEIDCGRYDADDVCTNQPYHEENQPIFTYLNGDNNFVGCTTDMNDNEASQASATYPPNENNEIYDFEGEENIDDLEDGGIVPASIVCDGKLGTESQFDESNSAYREAEASIDESQENVQFDEQESLVDISSDYIIIDESEPQVIETCPEANIEMQLSDEAIFTDVSNTCREEIVNEASCLLEEPECIQHEHDISHPGADPEENQTVFDENLAPGTYTDNEISSNEIYELSSTRPDLLTDHEVCDDDDDDDDDDTPVCSLGAYEEEINGKTNVIAENNDQEVYDDRSPITEEDIHSGVSKNVTTERESENLADINEADEIILEDEVPDECDVFEYVSTETNGSFVSSTDEVSDEQEVQKGLTKNLVSQWKQKGEEQFVAEKKGIVIEMSEGKVLENEPSRRREDIIGHDTSAEDISIVKGQTELIKQQLLSKPEKEVWESKPIKLTDESQEASVVENTPVKRSDVMREEDSTDEVMCLKKGFAKDLAEFWSSPKNECPAKQVKQPIELPKDDTPIVAENTPKKLEGVVRSDDTTKDVINIEQGRAKMIANLFQNMKEENVTKEVKLDINFEEPGVYENNPQEREGIIKSSDIIDEVKVQKGVIKSITDKFLMKEDISYKPRDMIKMEPPNSPSVIENNPEPPSADVIRSDTKVEGTLPVPQGMTKNLVQKWITNDLHNNKSTPNKLDDLTAILEAGKAAESGIFENHPTIRNDVAREDDQQPDIISTQTTRSTRDLWNQKINQEGKPVEKPPQLIRFTPPRELSPHKHTDETFKSFQKLTLA